MTTRDEILRRAQGDRQAGGRGFALVSAIFVLVVLALLGAMIVALSTTQHMGQVRDLFGSRAYFAARTGIEWGVYAALRNSSCAPSTTLPPLAGSAADFAVVVTCSVSGPFDEGGTTVRVYQLTSTATHGLPGAPDQVERQIQAAVSTP
jgi:MSHA biogenesis protein MshP